MPLRESRASCNFTSEGSLIFLARRPLLHSKAFPSHSARSPCGKVRRRAGHHLVRVDRAELLEHAADTPCYRGLACARGTRKPEVHADNLRRANNQGNEQRNCLSCIFGIVHLREGVKQSLGGDFPENRKSRFDAVFLTTAWLRRLFRPRGHR